MFYNKYIDDFYYEELLNNYSIEYLESIDEQNFIKVYNIFQKYNFYFIEDIIAQYLHLFEVEPKKIEDGILNLKKHLGENFIYIIGYDMTYLGNI